MNKSIFKGRKRSYSKITEYNGVKYHSKEEAKFAQKLDLLMKAGEIFDWNRQGKFELPGKTDKRKQQMKYSVDFTVVIRLPNFDEIMGNINKIFFTYYIEIKNEWTKIHNPAGELRRKWAESHHGIKIHVFPNSNAALNFVIDKIIDKIKEHKK